MAQQHGNNNVNNDNKWMNKWIKYVKIFPEVNN